MAKPTTNKSVGGVTQNAFHDEILRRTLVEQSDGKRIEFLEKKVEALTNLNGDLQEKLDSMARTTKAEMTQHGEWISRNATDVGEVARQVAELLKRPDPALIATLVEKIATELRADITTLCHKLNLHKCVACGEWFNDVQGIGVLRHNGESFMWQNRHWKCVIRWMNEKPEHSTGCAIAIATKLIAAGEQWSKEFTYEDWVMLKQEPRIMPLLAVLKKPVDTPAPE